MDFENSKVKLEGTNTKYNYDHVNREMEEIERQIPISRETIQQTPQPIYLNYEIYQQYMIPNPQDYKISHPKERSIFESNVIEFWAPITDKVIPDVVPGRYWVSTWGRTWNTNTQAPIGLSVHSKGYYQMCLNTNVPGKRVTRKFHRVIMLTFAYFDGCDKYEVNHRDSIRSDCRLYNLEWMTPSENTIYGINHGYKKVFGNDYTVTLSDEEVLKIIELHNNYNMNEEQIIRYMNLDPNKVSPTTVELIFRGFNRLSITNRI